MKRIGLLGAFSIDNPGDVAIGLAVRRALGRLVPEAELRLFAPRLPGAFWGHDFSGARGLDVEVLPVPAVDGPLDWARPLDALVIGGGGLIIPERGFDPFLLGDPHAWRDCRVRAAWNAVCAQGGAWDSPGRAAWCAKVRECCERLAHVSVRNPSTADFLRRIGFAGEIGVVPDCAFGLDLGPRPDAEGDPLDALLRRSGLDPAKRRIGLTVGSPLADPCARPFFRRLFASLGRLAREPGFGPAEVVLFPFGTVYGDAHLLAFAGEALPGAKRIAERLAPLDAWRLVGRMDLYVANRLYGMIAALVQNVPFLVLDEYLRPPAATSKVRDLAVEAGLEPHYVCPRLETDPDRKLADLLARAAAGTVDFAPLVAAARARLDEHYRTMLGRLLLPVEPRAEGDAPEERR